LAVVDEHDSVAFVIADSVILEIDDGGDADNAVVIVGDGIFGDEEFLTVKEEHTLASGILNLIVIDVVVDVAGALQHQVAVQTPLDYVLLEEGSASVADVDSVAEGGYNVVEEDVRVGVAVHLDAHLLVESHHVVPDLRFVPGSPHQQPSLFVLRDEVEPEDGPALAVLPRPGAHSILLVCHQIVFHYLGEAVLNLNSHLAVFDLVVEEVAAVAEESGDPGT
jgi:hypothetical protein